METNITAASMVRLWRLDDLLASIANKSREIVVVKVFNVLIVVDFFVFVVIVVATL